MCHIAKECWSRELILQVQRIPAQGGCGDGDADQGLGGGHLWGGGGGGGGDTREGRQAYEGRRNMTGDEGEEAAGPLQTSEAEAIESSTHHRPKCRRWPSYEHTGCRTDPFPPTP